jgi:hypothetical protein
MPAIVAPIDGIAAWNSSFAPAGHTLGAIIGVVKVIFALL